MEAGPVPFEELPDGGVRGERAEQLDVAHADPEQHGLHALLPHGLTVLNGHAEPLRVEGYRLVEILHRHADVIDSPEHGRGF